MYGLLRLDSELLNDLFLKTVIRHLFMLKSHDELLLNYVALAL